MDMGMEYGLAGIPAAVDPDIESCHRIILSQNLPAQAYNHIMGITSLFSGHLKIGFAMPKGDDEQVMPGYRCGIFNGVDGCVS